MRFLTIVLASLAVNRVICQLTAKDTIVEDDHPKFDAVMAYATDDTYFGYFYNKDSVWIKVHDADTHDIITEDTFKANGKAVQYLLQTSDVKHDELSADGPVGEMLGKPICPRPPAKRVADTFLPRASRCYQFCSRNHSCTADRRCPSCRYVGGLCRWQLWCI